MPKTAIFRIPFSLELALELSELINCRECGECCRTKGIYIAQEDTDKIAEHINTTSEVVRDMMHIEGEHMIMPCPFYDNECSKQSVKPVACKLYPLFQHPNGRLACSLECRAGIDIHNLIQEKLCQH